MSARDRIRTLLIEDSALMRKIITEIILTDQSLELVGVAGNGLQGAQLAEELRPDVIVTDMVMPQYDGLYVVNRIMQNDPIPIVVLSALEKTDMRIFDALNQGAFEFIDKPTNFDSEKIRDYRLLDLIRLASQTGITGLKAKQLSARRNNHAHKFEETPYKIIAIGASTGGPSAVEYVLSNLPSNLPLPVIIVQHMPQRFLETFTARLDGQILFPIRLAHNGEMVKNGTIYIAPGESNLRISRNIATGEPMFTTTTKKYSEFNYPSIDCLFESVAETYQGASIGVILTGMGKDGAAGLRKIKDNGGYTISQDEHSSIVYGMPKAAFETGAVRRVVSLKEMPGFIVSCL